MKMRRGLLSFGVVCLCAAALLSVFNFVSSDRAAVQAAGVVESLAPLLVLPAAEDTAQPLPTMPEWEHHPEREMPTVGLDSTRCLGRLEIPALGLNLPIAAAFSMQQLKKTPAAPTTASNDSRCGVWQQKVESGNKIVYFLKKA